MSTLLEIKTQAAGYLQAAVTDFTVNGVDLWLAAANQAVKTAELTNDFEFSRKLVTVSVNGATGGDLEDAVDADNAAVDVKSVIEVGLLDDNANLRPVVWTTMAESIERQRLDNRGQNPSIWRADWEDETPFGQSRFTFSGSKINRWPRTDESEAETIALWLEVYAFSTPWTASNLGVATITVTGGTGVTGVNTTYYHRGYLNGFPLYISSAAAVTYAIWSTGTVWNITTASDIGQTLTNYHSFASTSQSPAGTYTTHGTFTGTAVAVVGIAGSSLSDVWTTHGSQYLLWNTVVHLNHLFKQFVPRTEGNLPPPQQLATEGLMRLVEWDANKYELFRRHTR